MILYKKISFLLVLTVFGYGTKAQDSLSIGFDTLIQNSANNSTEKFAESSINSKIIHGALDSQVYDNKNKLWYLYGNAFVDYEDKKLKADYIVLDLENSVADAQKAPFNPFGKKPSFNDGGKEYTYNRLKYNFEDERGIVLDSKAQEGEFVIHAKTTKYISAKSNPYSEEDVINNKSSLITTCTHEEPHFGFRAKKFKYISNKVAVMGPSNLELSGIPTPIWIPFGFFPLTQGKSSGFIFPQDYEFNSRNKGFGLKGLGWYFPISDYIHTRITADLYTRGSYALYLNTNYKRKYKYNGSLYLSYDKTITEDVETAQSLSNTGFTLRLQHKQEAKAHPYIDVGGSINIIGNNNQRRVANDAQSVLTNTYTSNFYYRHSMPGTPFSFSFGLNHNQNTSTRIVNITLPDVKLNMNTIYPFKSKNKGSNKEMWYEKISFDYDMKFKSFVTATDTTLFTSEMYDNIKTGMNHKLNTGFSARVFKHFNIVPRAQLEETWVLNTINKENTILVDPITQNFSDSISQKTLTGFDNFRQYSAGISLNTQIFGTKTFAKGWLRGIRHTMKPDIGYAFAPDTRSQYTDTLYLANDRIEKYTRFDKGPFNTPSFGDLRSQITYRLTNILELKTFSKKDSTVKKLKLFDNFTINGSYNFAADSLKWSTVSMSSTSRFFNGVTTLSTSWTFDPYIEESNRAVNKTVWSEEGKLLRLERATIRLSNRLKFQKLQEIFGKKKESTSISQNNSAPRPGQSGPQNLNQAPTDQGSGAQSAGETAKQMISLMDLFNNISINHELKYDILAVDGVTESKVTTHSIAFTGSLPITDNWTVSIGNFGYDFVKKGLSYTAISFSRKLHCWNMNFSWYPNRDTYSFFIGVNSTNLSFLRYNYGQNNVDGLFNSFR